MKRLFVLASLCACHGQPAATTPATPEVAQPAAPAEDAPIGVVNRPPGPPPAAPPSLDLVLAADGHVRFDGKDMTPSDLDALFAAAVARDTSTQVVIRAEKDVPHDLVIKLMEQAKADGVKSLALGSAN